MFTISPLNKSFGLVPVNNTSDQTVTVENTGASPIIFGSISGADAPFSVVNDNISGQTLNGASVSSITDNFDGTVINSALWDYTTSDANLPLSQNNGRIVFWESANLVTTGEALLTSVATFSGDMTAYADMSANVLGPSGEIITGQYFGFYKDVTNYFVIGFWASYASGDTNFRAQALKSIDGVTDQGNIDESKDTIYNFRARISSNLPSVSYKKPTDSDWTSGLGGMVFAPTDPSNWKACLKVQNTGLGATDRTWNGYISDMTASQAAGGVGDSATAVIRFSPTSVGAFNDSIDLTSNDPITPLYNFLVDGTGQGAIVDISPVSPIAYGNVSNLSTTDQTVTISNSGDTALIIGTLSGLAAPYSLVNNSVSGATINAGDSSTVVVRYHPTVIGTTSDTLIIPSNYPEMPSINFAVSGTSLEADISVSPTVLALGNITKGESASGSVTVSNIGNIPLALQTVTGIASPFSITSNVAGAILTPTTTTLPYILIKVLSCPANGKGITLKVTNSVHGTYSDALKTATTWPPAAPISQIIAQIIQRINAGSTPVPLAHVIVADSISIPSIDATNPLLRLSYKVYGGETPSEGKIYGFNGGEGSFQIVSIADSSLSTPSATSPASSNFSTPVNSRTLGVSFVATSAGSYSNTLIINSTDPDTASFTLPIVAGCIEPAPNAGTGRTIVGNMIADTIQPGSRVMYRGDYRNGSL